MTPKTLAIYLGLAVLAAGLPVAPTESGVSSALAAGINPANSAKAAMLLSNLSPARAASAQNAVTSRLVEFLDTYETQMKVAFGLADPVKRATAIAVARENLALAANKRLTPSAIVRIDALLGLPQAPAALGTTNG